MKIKLLYIHPTNYGNLMMACSFIEHFYKIAHEQGIRVRFYLDVLDDYELDRVKKSLPPYIRVYREDLYDRKKRGLLGKITKITNIPRELYYWKNKYDACIVLGGDCISQYYSKQVFVSDLLKIKVLSKHIPVMLVGQTMGPFSGYAIKLVNHCLSNCEIFLRDHDCYSYMKNLFPTFRLRESRDLAFLDIPYQNDARIQKETIEKYIGDTKLDYVTVVASGANRQYTSNEDDYIKEYVEIIKHLIDVNKLDVLLLAHVIHVSDSNDKKIIDKLLPRFDNRYLNRIHVVDHLIYPYEARILIGHGAATITGRMHAAVSSINMGTVPICLSYSVKFKGVIGDDFDLNSYILECRGDEFWADGKVHAFVAEKMDQLLIERGVKKESIYQCMNETKNKAHEQIVDAYDIIKKLKQKQ